MPENDWRVEVRSPARIFTGAFFQRFRRALSTLIGLDHGSRRIGVAVGDTETGMAFARAAIVRRNLEVDLDAIEALASAESAALIVIGLPLNMDGTRAGRQHPRWPSASAWSLVASGLRTWTSA